MINRFNTVEFNIGNIYYRVSGDRVWVQGFGTTGPNQTPHYNWIECKEREQYYKNAMNYMGSNL